LRSSAPELLQAHGDFPNVMAYDKFRERYCVIRMKKISNFNSIPVVVGGRNLPELRQRMQGWMLRRTQADVGIRPPVQELMPLIVSEAKKREVVGDEKAILDAIEQGRTKELEMELGPLRRITGRIKAEAVVAAAKEWLDDNPGEKLVLAYYHREVGDLLVEGLSAAGPCRVDGATTLKEREYLQTLFISDPLRRVFLAQLDAASEAIDLSAAAELWFVETTFSPKTMRQMGSRISNVNQTKNTFVKVCFIESSIDEAIQASLLRLWSAIKEVTHG
jgi:SNF2 family DNA or RNA helicase